MPRAPKIGLIIPVWNDARELDRLLQWADRNGLSAGVWVVDGGSDDDSKDVVQRYGARVLEVNGGRGAQMNAGAMVATEAGVEVLWFLHADAVPPDGACAGIAAAVANGAKAGAFRRRFDSRSRWLRFTCWLADWRCRWFGWFLGDQGIFVTADVFSVVGGFPEWPWFEDLEFSRRVRRVARGVLLPPVLRTSGRRFEAVGPWRQTWRDAWAVFRYLWSGRPPPSRRGVEQEKRRPIRAASSKRTLAP